MTPSLDEQRDPGVARLLDEQACRAFGMVAYAERDGELLVAIRDTDDTLAASLARASSGHNVVMVEASEAEIIRALDEAFGSESAAPAMPSTPVKPAGPRVGERLIAGRFATQAQIDAALEEQQRSGGRIGEILVRSGVVSEPALLAVLSEHYDVQRVDLTGFEADPSIATRIPEPVARRRHVVPVAAEQGVLYVAAPELLDSAAMTELRGYAGTEVRELLSTRASIDELLRRIYGEQYVHESLAALEESAPEDSAHRVMSAGQKVFAVFAIAAIVVALVLATTATVIGIVAACSFFYLAVSLYRFRLAYLALGHKFEIEVTPEEIAALDERTLPTYTVLCPLYHEANVVAHLTEAINQMDYPKTKLDVRLLCEADDEETIAAIEALHLPPHFSCVVVPDSQPKTKPKACNYGLLQATGDFVVIYDGEDRPDPDQLKKAIVAFAKSPENTGCIQAKLNFFNREQNLLTRWFSIEYAMQFDLLLPGLDVEGAPIPLGGSSNHFKASVLKELGAWDPYNVTEDCDLGIRLHKAGLKTSMMDSTTLEEANSDLHNWVRQRSRWCKGYYQTWLVHMRHPFRLMRSLGLKGFASFNMTVGGAFIFLLNPVFWTLTSIYLLTQAHAIEKVFPGFVFYAAASMLFIGNFTFLYMNMAGALQRGYFGLARYALLIPVYWGLMSWAAWKGALQLISRPFYWEKTKHGLVPGGDQS